jgi:hypothetical protein
MAICPMSEVGMRWRDPGDARLEVYLGVFVTVRPRVVDMHF